MSYEDTLKIRHTAEFEIVENELWIYHGFDLGDIKKDVTGFFMNRDEAIQLRNFLSKWLDGADPVAVARARNYGDWNGSVLDDSGNPKLQQALRRMERQKICQKCGQDPYDGHDMCTGGNLGAELGRASMAIFEAQKAAKAAEKPCQHEIYASHSTLQWLGSSLNLHAGTQLYRCTTCDGRFDLEMAKAD